MGMWASPQDMTSCSATWTSPTAFTCCLAARASTIFRVSISSPLPSAPSLALPSPQLSHQGLPLGSVHHKGKTRESFRFHPSGPPDGLVEQKPALPHFHGGVCQHGLHRGAREGGICPGAPSEAALLEGSRSEWPADLRSPLPSTGWIFLVNHILWHLSALGKVCPQLLYRASREQLAHSAGTQWLLHEI